MLGLFPKIGGAFWRGQATGVPLPLLESYRQYPIPITIGGSNNITFTVLASTTRPVRIWSGQDFVNLTWNVAYTWTNTSNAILHATTGAETTDTDSALGVWYMYMKFNESGKAVSLIPSQGAPGYVEAPGHKHYLGHPGTARSESFQYVYVGFMECTTAATPAFRTAIKVGYWYKFAPIAVTVITDAWTAPTSLTLRIPKLGKYGLEVQGAIKTGADGQIFVGSNSASSIYDAYANISEATASNVAQQTLEVPFQTSPNDTSSPLYAIAAPAGTLTLTGIKDVV